MLRSLRSKLVLSHVAVILMAFILTALIASVPIRRAQEARLQNSLILSSESVARQIDLTRTLTPDSDLLRESTQVEFARRLVEAEQRRSGNRIVVLDQDGLVRIDSAPSRSYEDETLPSVASAIDELSLRIGTNRPPGRAFARAALVLQTSSVPAGDTDGRQTVVAATGATSLPERLNLYVAAIAPRRSAPLIDDFVRPLGFAAALGIVVSVILGLLISRSVTGPLQRLSSTVGTINVSGLDQRVDVEAGGEVGTLVAAFNRMLERLASTYRSQRDLLANIAHELRTPLTSIQGYAQALRDDVIHDEQSRTQALETISDEARRMTELVEQILQLSRLESGQLPMQFDRVSISGILTRIGRQFTPLASERNISLVVDNQSDFECVLDAELIVQAVGNLTANAIRHTEAGGRVEIRASRVSTPSAPPGLRLTVRDTGAGMTEEQLERVFERFYRAGDRSRQHDTRNFGLGLAIVHEIVSRHAGELSVESNPGQGTTFTIDVPLEPDASDSSRS